jgi:hypothetical protein
MSSIATDAVLKAYQKKNKLSDSEIKTLKVWANDVAYFETKGDPSKSQDSGGPGRGKYQYEMQGNRKGQQGAKTASNRFNKFEAENGSLPISKTDRAELAKDDPDFSKLSSTTQDAVFFADHMYGKTKMVDIVKGKISPFDAYRKWHWAGDDKEVGNKQQRWQEEVVPTRDARMQAETEQRDQEAENRTVQEAVTANTFPQPAGMVGGFDPTRLV